MINKTIKTKKEQFFYEEYKRSRRKLIDKSRRELNIRSLTVNNNGTLGSSLESQIKVLIEEHYNDTDLLFEEIINSGRFEELLSTNWFIDNPNSNKIIDILEILEDLSYASTRFVEEIKKSSFELLCVYLANYFGEDVRILSKLLIVFGNIVNDTEENEEYFIAKKYLHILNIYLSNIAQKANANITISSQEHSPLLFDTGLKEKLLWFVQGFDFRPDGIFSAIILESILYILSSTEDLSKKDFKALYGVIKNTNSDILSTYTNLINNIITANIKKASLQKTLLLAAAELIKRNLHVHEAEIIMLFKNNKNNPKTSILACRLSIFAIQNYSEDFTRINFCKEKYIEMYLNRINISKDSEIFKVSLQNMLYLVLFVDDKDFYDLMFYKYCNTEFFARVLATKKTFLSELEYSLILDAITLLIEFVKKEGIALTKKEVKKLASQVFLLQYSEIEKVYLKAYHTLGAINLYCNTVSLSK